MESSGPQSFASPKVSGSPDLKSVDLTGADADPEQMAKEDPLATQVWRMYARQKATLPHAQRMENLTWRMMALALKKKKEDEGKERERAREKGKGREADAQAGNGPGFSGEKVEGDANGRKEGCLRPHREACRQLKAAQIKIALAQRMEHAELVRPI